MSALGHKRTIGGGRAMSALPPKADMVQHARDVPLCAKSGLVRRSNCDRYYCRKLRIFASSWRGLNGLGTYSSYGSRLHFLPTKRVGGDGDDRDRSQSRISFNPARRLVTVHDGQLDIHQDGIGPLFCDGSERLLTVPHLRDLVISGGPAYRG
jgi:hypothetical protein